jgi:mono/diheme cytochrome c family protein
MRSPSALSLVALLAASPVLAQGPTYGLGRAPTQEEVLAWDISVHPITGAELPAGQGTAVEGALVYRRNCARCHGAEGAEGRAPRLVRTERPREDPWQYGRILPIRSPYAPTVWDYINRGMPLNREGTLTHDEVYALTALLLYWNGIIGETDVMNAETLPAVQMPNRENWAPLPDFEPNTPRLPGYPY